MVVYWQLGRKIRLISQLGRAFCRYMSNQGSTHLERTASLPRETVSAVGTVVRVTDLSKTVKGISIHVPDVQFMFKAGQWVDFTIPGVETVGGFSMYSSPGKLKKHRLVDLAVKRSDHPPAYWVHTKCQVGSQVSLKVGGDFFYDSVSKRPVELLLVAGGVGINPLYSILQQISELSQEYRLGDEIKVSLLYSASSVNELVFKEELDMISKSHPNIKCQYFVTRDRSVLGYVNQTRIQSGRISHVALQEALKTFDKDIVTVYVCGPKSMIDFVTSTLENFGLSKQNINKEEWW